MIKYIYISIISLPIVLQSCQDKQDAKTVHNECVKATSLFYYPNKNIKEMTKIFLDSLGAKNSIKELFIDRVYENEVNITFKAKKRLSSYLENNRPLLIYYYDKQDSLYVYTGIETIFRGDLKNINNKIDSDTTDNYYLIMTFTLKNEKFTLDRVATLPFTPKSHYVTPPNINVNKFLSTDSSKL